MLYFVNKDVLAYAAWPGIQREAANVENAQNQRLKSFLAITLYPLGPPYLGCHDLESIKTLVIASSSESKLGRLNSAGSRLERKALELHQDRVEETRLDYLVMEIIKCKKAVAARQIQLDQNLAKEKEVVEMLAVMIRQSQADNVAVAANNKKLKEEKESKGGVIARALSNLSKSTEFPPTTAPPLTTAPPPTSTSFFSHALSPNNSAPQPAVEAAITAWISPISTVSVVWTTQQLVGTEPTSLTSFYVILGAQKCPNLSTDFAKDYPASSPHHASAKDEMDKMQSE